jgi:hypothetical protein
MFAKSFPVPRSFLEIDNRNLVKNPSILFVLLRFQKADRAKRVSINRSCFRFLTLIFAFTYVMKCSVKIGR